MARRIVLRLMVVETHYPQFGRPVSRGGRSGLACGRRVFETDSATVAALGGRVQELNRGWVGAMGVPLLVLACSKGIVEMHLTTSFYGTWGDSVREGAGIVL